MLPNEEPEAGDTSLKSVFEEMGQHFRNPLPRILVPRRLLPAAEKFLEDYKSGEATRRFQDRLEDGDSGE